MSDDKLTAKIVTGTSPEWPSHPDPLWQARLNRIKQGLGKTHALAYCQGCTWSLRWPLREIEGLRSFRTQHIGSAHFNELLKGNFALDPDLADGGEAYLRKRLIDAKKAARQELRA